MLVTLRRLDVVMAQTKTSCLSIRTVDGYIRWVYSASHNIAAAAAAVLS